MARAALCVLFILCSLGFIAGCSGSGSTSTTTQPSNPSPSQNPTPSITSIAPSSIIAGSSAQTLTVTGSGFVASTVINFNSVALTTTYVSSTQVKASVPASAITADGTAKVTASNPAPGGGASPSQSYTITVPTAAVAALSPQSVTQGQAVTITVTGTGFEANSVAMWNGSSRPTTFVNSTTLKVVITAADVQNFGTGQVSVANPGLSPTTPVDLLIIASTPTITSLSPNSVPAYTGSNVPQQVYIGGSGFAQNATVQANGGSVTVVSQSVTSILVSLPASLFAAPGSISLVVSNPGTPVVSSNSASITVTGAAAPSFAVSPNYAPAGSPDTTITLTGTGFYPDSEVSWNNTNLVTTYVSSTSLTAVIPASLLTGFAQASIGVSTPEDSVQPTPQPFDTFLDLPINDIVYNPVDGLIYASIPGSAGEGLGNSIAAIEPTTGVVQKTIFVGSEPNRLALSTDGTQLFVGLNGAGAVRRVNLATGTAQEQFSLGGGPGIYNPPYTAVSLAAVPAQPNSVAVYGSNGVVTIFDTGVARSNTSSGLEVYFDSNVGGLTFGSSASTLYVMSNAIGGYLYKLTVDATGITASTQLGTGTGGSTLQYDNGFLYTPQGLVFSAATGDQVGQFSVLGYSSTTPTTAAGPIVSDSTLNLAWILPGSGINGNQLVSFNETTFNPVASIPITGIGDTSPSSGPGDLIRWGQNGLAFHTSSQLYVLQGPIVKDTSGSPADLSLTLQAPTTAATGSTLTYTIHVANGGPDTATGVAVTTILPQSLIFGSTNATQGSCSGSGITYCDLGSIASGSSVSITISATPTTAGKIEATAGVASTSYDPASANNQASATTTVTGSAFNATPEVTQLSPAILQAGSSTFTLTVDGESFNSGSTVLWNGQPLPTTYLSAGQLTATVDSSLVQQLGWSLVSVSTPAPGGGQSSALPFSVYQILNVDANAISYDPFTRKLYAVLPSTSTNLTGNSIVAIDPTTGSIGTPIQVGSEPNLLSETSDGNYFYIGLSGAESLGRFNLLNQALDLTVPLPNNVSFPGGQAAAVAIATVPGSDTSLAVENNSFNGIGIFDITGSTGAFRPNSSSAYSGDNPVFADATHFYAYDSSTTGAEFYRYTVNSSGVVLTDGTTLDGMGGFNGRLGLDGGLVYGSGGGIINPATTPPSQVAVLPLGAGPYGTGLFGGGVIPYAAESKSFNIGVNAAGTALDFIERFDTQHFTLEQQIQLPNGNVGGVSGTRWGQDGLAYIIPNASGTQQQMFLIQGPFVLPAEAVSNTAPQLTTTGSNTITAGSGNAYVTVNGSGFLAGATVFWNGSPRTTTYNNAQQLTVAIPASDLKTAGTAALTCKNPGSGSSNTIDITLQ